MDNITDTLRFLGTYIVPLFVIFGIVRLLVSRGIQFYHSHWNHLVNNFNFSTEEFYIKFKKELLSHGVSGINAVDVTLREGNIFSSRRRYIRIKWKDYQYDICAAPFGDGFFVSWWLLQRLSWLQIIISLIPFIGAWLVRKLFPVTYYRIDTASIFMTYAHSSVLKVIEDITKDKGTRALTESERKPILNDIFKR